jgi:hypothetical protein
MCAPTRPFNAVMWDEAKDQPIPCVLSAYKGGWGLGSRYADGTTVTKHIDSKAAVFTGIDNLEGLYIRNIVENSDNSLYVRCVTTAHAYTLHII